jgi:hypothetical protein
MSQFEPVTLKWDGVEYTVPQDKMMEVIARIEEHVTLDEVHGAMNGNIKRVKLARAFGSVLRFAGAKLTDEDVYAGMFKLGVGNVVLSSVITLMALMVPPKVVTDMQAKADAGTLDETESHNPGNSNRRARRAAASSSSQRSKRRPS